MRAYVLFIFITLGTVFPENAAADVHALYSKQIAWAAANIDNPKVVSQFRESFQELLTNKKSLSTLQTPEGQKVLQQGRNLISAFDLRDRLEKCTLEQNAAKAIRDAIAGALGSQALATEACAELVAKAPKIFRFNQELESHFQDDVRNGIIKAAQSQLQQTQSYWAEVEKQDPINLAVELTERELEIKEKAPHAGAELLLYTQALRNRKNKTYISKTDVKDAFSEVHKELQENKNYLQQMTTENPETALRRLLVTNPGAAAQYLIAHPEALDLVCRSLQVIDKNKGREETLDTVFFWGGIVIAGVLIVSGVGAFAGGAMAATLATVAAGAAITGTVTAVGDTVYSSSKAHESYIDAQNIRSAAYGEGLSAKSSSRIDEAKNQAQSDLIGASFSAASIVPFGVGFKVMKNAAQASRLGSYARISKEGAAVEVESSRSLAKVLQEVSSDKKILKALETSQTKVPEEEMGQFLGYLSSLPSTEKARVFELIKAKPEKLSEAIRESSQAGVCK